MASELLCPICLAPVRPGEAVTECQSCRTAHHEECWRENGGCAVYGCPHVPPTEKLSDVEMPASFWGQEHKQCPACGEQILAAAVRCRHCGATFASGRPEDAEEFRRRARLEQSAAGLRRSVVAYFVFSTIPVSAPFALLYGGLWYHRNRASLQQLPGLYGALGRMALWVSVGQVALAVVVVSLYSIFRSASA